MVDYALRPEQSTETVAPSVFETVSAAIRTENPVYAAMEWALRKQPEVDPNFDFITAAKNSRYWSRSPEALLGAVSKADLFAREARLSKEYEDRQLLADQGWGGFVAMMGAGLLSPTTLLPLIGGAKGIEAIKSAAKWSAIAAVADEIPLLANQLSRTPEETGINIAASTVLGGLLGSAAVLLRKADLDDVARAMSEGETGPGPVVRGREVMLPEGKALQGLDAPVVRPDPPQEGFVRVYHSGSKGEGDFGRWVSTSEKYAADYRADLPLYYMDIPANDARIQGVYPEQGVKQGFTFNFELKPEEATALKITSRDEQVSPHSFAIENAQSAGARATAERFNIDETFIEDGKLVTRPLATEEEIALAGAEFAPIGPEFDTSKWAPSWLPRKWVGKVQPLAWIARTSPVARGIMQLGQPVKSVKVAQMFSQLSDSGLAFKGNAAGLSAAAEGTVEARLAKYMADYTTFAREQYDAYMRYLFDGDTNWMQRRVGGARIELNRPPKGKISFEEFKSRVMDSSAFGDNADSIAEVNAAAVAYRKFFESTHEAAQEAANFQAKDSIYKEFNPSEEGETYTRHDYDSEKISANRQKWLNLLTSHYEQKVTETFTKRIEKLMKKVSSFEDFETVARLEREEALKLYDELSEEIKRMPDAGELSADVDKIKALRQEARTIYEEVFDELEETRNPDGDAELTAAHRIKARDQVKDEVARLKEQAQLLEDALPEPVTKAKESKAKLRALQRAVNKGFARVEKKHAETLETIERNEELNLKSFERVVRENDRFLKEMDKLSSVKLAAEKQKVERSLKLALKAFERTEKKLAALRKTDPEGVASSMAEVDGEIAVLKLQAALDRLFKTEARDVVALRQAVADARQAAFEKISGTNNKRAERNALLRQKAERLTPEEVEAGLQSTRSALDGLIEDLERQIIDAGGVDVDIRRSGKKFDFSDIAKEQAEDLTLRMEGNFGRAGQIEAVTFLRSPMKKRMLDIPYELKQEFLDKDTEAVAFRYARTMGGDIEMFRATGSVNGETHLRLLKDEYLRLREHVETRIVDENGKKITDARRAKEAAAMQRAMAAREREYRATVDRIRGLWGVPKNAAGAAYRMGRLFLDWNVTTMMGVSAISSLADIARPVMVHGFTRTFGDGWSAYLKNLTSEAARATSREVQKELDYLGIGQDVFSSVRARGTMEIGGTDFSNRWAIERFFSMTANKMPQVALFGPWTDGMKTVAGRVTLARFMRHMQDFNEGKATRESIAYLAEAGISAPMARRIWAEIDRTGTRVNDLVLPNTAEWKDYQALRVFHAAMSREDARLVITPGLEKPLWMDETMTGRILSQFQSFTLSAHMKILASGLQQRNMAQARLMQGVVFALASGALSYYLWAMTAGPRQREEMQNASLATWMDQAFYRAGLDGAFSIPRGVAQEIPGLAPYVSFSGEKLAGRRADNVAGAAFGPSFGKAMDIFGLVVGLDDPTQGTTNIARQLLPFQNVFYLKSAFEALERGVNNLFDLPERRQ